MKQIIDKESCCGCNACGDICAHAAISFKTDIEGFWYPEIDQAKCVDCGLCMKVCPVVNVERLKHNDLQSPECYAAIHKNLEVRFDSTSGGIFSALAEYMYRQKGYVGGAIYNDDFSVRQFISPDKSDLSALRSSKYLQSNAEGFYILVRDLLNRGEKVLVCGTPCQMAALRAFLHKPYENLIIIDFICRGINSPKAMQKFYEDLEKKANSKLVYIKAKNKELGWRNLTTKYIFDNKKVIYLKKDENTFTKGYLQTNVFCRPSCYDCQFKGFPRIADITIADFWGAEENVSKDLDNDLGTSLVLVNSEKGRVCFDKIANRILSESITLNDALKGNPALIKPLDAPNVNRECFYRDLDKNDYQYIVDKYISSPSSKQSLRRKLVNLLHFGRLVKDACGWSVPTFIKNLKYNFFSRQTKTDILAGKYMVIYKHSIIELHKNARIDINGIFRVGNKKFKDSRLETRLLIDEGGRINVRGSFDIGYGSDVEVFKGALLECGGHSGINMGATIICAEHILLEREVMIGRNVTIRDNNGGHYLSYRGYKNTRPVVVGQHVWLCEGCTIMLGVHVHDGAIIGAHTLVQNNVPAFTVVSGNPAKIVDEDVYWKY